MNAYKSQKPGGLAGISVKSNKTHRRKNMIKESQKPVGLAGISVIMSQHCKYAPSSLVTKACRLGRHFCLLAII